MDTAAGVFRKAVLHGSRTDLQAIRKLGNCDLPVNAFLQQRYHIGIQLDFSLIGARQKPLIGIGKAHQKSLHKRKCDLYIRQLSIIDDLPRPYGDIRTR